MQCQTCNSRNSIEIKNKHYCSDCGSPVQTQTPPEQSSKPQPAPQAPPPDREKPETKPRVLDLSSQTRQEPESRLQTTAQTIHGVRNQAHASSPAQAKEPKPQIRSQKRRDERHQRAAQVSRSPEIQKFPAQLATAEPPAEEKPELPPEPMMLNPRATYMVNKKAAQADMAASIAMQHQRFSQPEAARSPQAAAAAPEPKARKLSIFKRFTQLFKGSPKFAMATSIALSVVILGGYITYLNYPNLSVRIAASRAGIDANLPGYIPSGYSFNGIDHESGQLTIKFASNSDAGFINVSQSSTGWDSESLLENHVLNRSRNYQTFQEKGLTIYIYGGNNAAWVNRGTFYSIEGNNHLNHEQILRVATSL